LVSLRLSVGLDAFNAVFEPGRCAVDVEAFKEFISLNSSRKDDFDASCE